VRLLLEREAQHEDQCREDLTSLLAAAYNGHEAVVQLLLMSQRPGISALNVGYLDVVRESAQVNQQTMVQLLLAQAHKGQMPSHCS
jgi:hypothetical protein